MPPSRTPPHILTLVALAALSALNMNMFLPSLPDIARDLRADYAVAQFAVSGYLAATAALQLLMGPLSDRYGRRPVILGAGAIFILGSIGCALAPDVAAFLAFRMLGASVVAGMALGRAVVRDMHGATQSASMIGYVTMGMAVAPMLGPMVGGALDEMFGWRATFWALAGVGACVLALSWRDLGETHGGGGSMRAQFAAYPLLLGAGDFWVYAMGAACASGAFFAFLGGAPYVAQALLGLSPAATGFYFGLIAVGYAFGNYLSGRFAARVGLAGMMGAGALVALAGVALTATLMGAGLSHPLAFFGPIGLIGLGNGVGLPSAMAGSVSVRPELAGSAAGLSGALMVGGGAALSSLSGALLGEGSGATPMLWVMAASLMGAAISAAAARAADRRLNA